MDSKQKNKVCNVHNTELFVTEYNREVRKKAAQTNEVHLPSYEHPDTNVRAAVLNRKNKRKCRKNAYYCIKKSGFRFGSVGALAKSITSDSDEFVTWVSL